MQLRFAQFVLDSDLFELRRDGRPVEIQPKALSLLLYLLQNGSRTVGKRELLDEVWPGVTVGEGSLTRAINGVRTALGEAQRDGRIVRTVHARGYRVAVPVTVDTPGALEAESGSDFVCRERELQVGREVLEASFAGRGQVLVLSGEQGIGKTRLAEELVGVAAARGAESFWGRCHDGEGVPAFWPWIQILRSYLREREPDALLEQLGAGAPELAEIVPEVRERLPELPDPEGPPARARFRLFLSVAQLLEAGATERPLVLALDDLHRADRGSLRLLEFLGRELASARVLVLVAYRDTDVVPEHPLGATLAELARGPCSKRTIHLPGLDVKCVRRFLERSKLLDVRDELVDAVYRRSEGNPLFVRELVHWLEARPAGSDRGGLEIPEGVRQVIRSRLALLPPESSGVLQTAAVIGRDFTVPPLARASGLDEAALLARLAPAEATRVIVPGPGGRFRFSHPLIRDTLYQELPSAARVQLHGAVARALEELYTPRPIAPTNLPVPIDGSHLAELAHHFGEATVGAAVDKALEYALRAGEHAERMLAFEEADRLYQRGLELLERAPPGAALADLRSRLARVQAARES